MLLNYSRQWQLSDLNYRRQKILSFNKNIVFPVEAEYSYFCPHFRLKLFLLFLLHYSIWQVCFPECIWCLGPFLETFRACKAIAKSLTLSLQGCFILFIQEVSGVYTSPFLDTDKLKMPLRAHKVSTGLSRNGPQDVAVLSNFVVNPLLTHDFF